MRIALVSQEYPPETAHGGIGTQNHAKAHGLAARGHQMHVISQSTDEQRQEYSDGLVHVTRIPGFDKHLPLATEEARWITYSAQVAVAVATLHAHHPLDLVEFAEWGSEGYVHLLNQTQWNKIPTVVHLHGPIVMFAEAIGWPDPTSEFYRTARMMEETCLRRADAVYSSSRCSAEWCQRHYGLDSTRIPIIHTGIDTSTFRPLPVPKAENPTVIFVGKIERNKGVELLVEAACELRREIPNLRLRLIGRGNAELIESLKEMAYAADAPRLVEFVGFVPHHQLPDHLSRAHVFAAPSQYEGGPGFVYLEAMACGLPVIACSGSGASEVVLAGETGLLVSPHAHNALVQALNLLLTDAQLRNQLGVNACEHVTRHASRETCLTSLEDFYLSVLAGRRHEEAVNQCQ